MQLYNRVIIEGIGLLSVVVSMWWESNQSGSIVMLMFRHMHTMSWFMIIKWQQILFCSQKKKNTFLSNAEIKKKYFSEYPLNKKSHHIYIHNSAFLLQIDVQNIICTFRVMFRLGYINLPDCTVKYFTFLVL